MGKGLASKGPPAHHPSPAGAQHASPSAAALGGASMVATPSLAGTIGGTTFNSPSHAALAAVGMEPSASSNAMGLSMSGLGLNSLPSNLGMNMMAGLSGGILGASSMGLGVGPTKLDDAERRHRLETVLNVLGSRTGRISQEGLERLARRMGLEMFSEMREGGRSVVIAGTSMFAVDVSCFSTTTR